MRQIKYKRTEFHGDDEPVENDLLCFIYDIPYLGACGIFPPIHILNEILSSGGGDGGMGPGAAWEPFRITDKEYSELKQVLINTPLEFIRNKVRYGDAQFEFDSEFDSLQDQMEWLQNVCNKHRESYHRRIKHDK